jgi:sugar transferase (PEP-CTERM/EpsH1 system associated)
MSNLLYLGHRLPYPPNKGDKLGSYNLLKHLAANHTVYMGTFVDDPADEAYVDIVRAMCADLHVSRLTPRFAKVRSLIGLLTGEPLSVRYYRDAPLSRWVKNTLATHDIDAIVIFSSAMAQFVSQASGGAPIPMLVNFADVDSAKWTQYAANHAWPMSWLYRREGEKLLSYERAVAKRSLRSFFVTEKEVSLFGQLAPECADLVEVMCNGVDSDYFSPDPARASPFVGDGASPEQIPLVFTGAMDYWPNVDAVIWFATDILPRLRRAQPNIRFYIVGRSPAPAVLALASDAVVVTGTVPDVRPYLQHAALVVAPLRVARGIQNKILEAMAMARPVLASQSCVEAIDASTGEELISVTDADDFVQEIETLLQAPDKAFSIGQAGRARVVKSYSWTAHLSVIDPYLHPKSSPQTDS